MSDEIQVHIFPYLKSVHCIFSEHTGKLEPGTFRASCPKLSLIVFSHMILISSHQNFMEREAVSVNRREGKVSYKIIKNKSGQSHIGQPQGTNQTSDLSDEIQLHIFTYSKSVHCLFSEHTGNLEPGTFSASCPKPSLNDPNSDSSSSLSRFFGVT